MSPKRDPETWMWERAKQLLEQADEVHRRYFELSGSRAPSWNPPVDVFETESELWVLVALPGVDPERVDVTLENSILIVSGSRSVPRALRRARVHRMEIPTGRFERRVRLPAGTYEIGKNEMNRGCLVLSFRKVE